MLNLKWCCRTSRYRRAYATPCSRRGLLPAVRAFIDFLAEQLPPQLKASRLDCGGACGRAKEKIKASALGALAVDAG